MNLTPHDVTLANGTLKIEFAKDPYVPTARVEQLTEERTLEYEVMPGMFIYMPVNVVTRTTVYGLPEPVEGIIYICSSMVASHVRRPDVIAPITDSTCVRDESGKVVSVKGFQTFNHDYKFPMVEAPVVEEISEAVESIMEIAEELTAAALDVVVPVAKIDLDMLDPIKAAQKMKDKEKYLKRMAKAHRY